jgi:hypothetical protein
LATAFFFGAAFGAAFFTGAFFGATFLATAFFAAGFAPDFLAAGFATGFLATGLAGFLTALAAFFTVFLTATLLQSFLIPLAGDVIPLDGKARCYTLP